MGNRVIALVVAALTLAADQFSKWAMDGPLALERRGTIELLPIFRFTWVENRGISLGMAQAQNDFHRWLIVVGTGLVALGVAWWITREEKRGDQIALALVLGGALGNIADRARLGHVVDFLDLHFGSFRPFFIFNVADAAISIGVVILLVRAFLASRKAKPESPEHA